MSHTLKEPIIKLSTDPKYRQVYDHLMKAIKTGELREGERLCTEAELKEQFNVSSITVVRAIKEVEKHGLLERRRGKGTFIKKRERNRCKNSEKVSGTVYLCGVSPTLIDSELSVNWFISHEIHRGVSDAFVGKVKIVPRANDLLVALKSSLPEDRNVIYVNPNDEMLHYLRHENINYVAIDQHCRYRKAEPDTIGLERMNGIMEGLGYLINSLKHRDIALISNEGNRERYMGYCLALNTFGIPFKEELVIRIDYKGGVDAGRNAVEELLRRNVAFSAIFADTDGKAAGVIESLQANGIKVPEDVSVLGFDDLPGADNIRPPLTTIRVPLYEMGVEAVKLLKERIKTKTSIAGKILPATLIKRKSCMKFENSQ